MPTYPYFLSETPCLIFRAESEQMAAILDLMQKNSDKFGNPSAEEMHSQMRLYL